MRPPTLESGPAPAPRRRPLGPLLFAMLAPLLAFAGILGVWSAVATGNPAHLLLPLPGPWTGHLIGHSDCTYAAVWPVRSWLLAASAMPLILGATVVNHRGVRFACLGLSFVWAVAWSLTSLASLINAST